MRATAVKKGAVRAETRLKRLRGQGWHWAVGGCSGGWGTAMSGMTFGYEAAWGKADGCREWEAINSWINQWRWDQLPLLSLIPSNSDFHSLEQQHELQPDKAAWRREKSTHPCLSRPSDSRQVGLRSELLPSPQGRVWGACSCQPQPTLHSWSTAGLAWGESEQLWVTAVNTHVCVPIVWQLVLVGAELAGVRFSKHSSQDKQYVCFTPICRKFWNIIRSNSQIALADSLRLHRDFKISAGLCLSALSVPLFYFFFFKVRYWVTILLLKIEIKK